MYNYFKNDTNNQDSLVTGNNSSLRVLFNGLQFLWAGSTVTSDLVLDCLAG